MRGGEVDRAEEIFRSSTRYCRSTSRDGGIGPRWRSPAEQLDVALALIGPLVDVSDDPEYRAIYAEVLAARGERDMAVCEAERAAAGYEELLARRPEAYAHHAAAFFTGMGHRPQRAVELAEANWKLRDTPRSRRLLAKALRNAEQGCMTLALAGLAAGSVHVLSGPDHLAAIAPYAVTDKTRSWRTGVRWGLGHGAGVLGVGLLVLLARHALPVDAMSAHSELGVGLVLVAIGIWGTRAAFLRLAGPARASPATTSTTFTGVRRWRSGRFTEWRAAPICWGSCRRSPCPRTRQRLPICSASARAT